MPSPIRRMEDGDYDQVQKIWLQGSVDTQNWMHDPQAFWEGRLGEFRTDTLQRADVRFVFVEDSRIRGFVTGRGDYLLELFVAPPYGKGIGSAILEHLKAEDGREHLQVSVYMLNHNAIRCYIKNYFIITHLYVEEKTGLAKFFMTWSKEYEQKMRTMMTVSP